MAASRLSRVSMVLLLEMDYVLNDT